MIGAEDRLSYAIECIPLFELSTFAHEVAHGLCFYDKIAIPGVAIGQNLSCIYVANFI